MCYSSTIDVLFGFGCGNHNNFIIAIEKIVKYLYILKYEMTTEAFKYRSKYIMVIIFQKQKKRTKTPPKYPLRKEKNKSII